MSNKSYDKFSKWEKLNFVILETGIFFGFIEKLKFSVFVNLLILHQQLTYFLFHFSSFVLVLVFLSFWHPIDLFLLQG